MIRNSLVTHLINNYILVHIIYNMVLGEARKHVLQLFVTQTDFVMQFLLKLLGALVLYKVWILYFGLRLWDSCYC